MYLRALLTISILLLAGCDPQTAGEAPGDAGDEARTVGVSLDPEREVMYMGLVSFDPEAGSVYGSITTILPARGRDSAEFFLNGGLQLMEVRGPAVTGYTMDADPEGWSTIRVGLDPAATDEVSEIAFAYRGVPVMPDNGINAIRADWVEISVDSAVIPVLTSFDKQIKGELMVGLPEDWTVVAPTPPVWNGHEWTLELAVPNVDIPFVGAPNLETLSDGNATVYHRGRPDEAAAVLAASARCTPELNARYGQEWPLPVSSYVLPDREDGGYARKTHIVLTDVSEDSEAALTNFVCHELAHFWSSGAPPLTVENWLNEAFAVYVASRITASIYGEEFHRDALADWRERAEGQPSIWTAADQSRRPYEVNYKKGPLALERLRKRVGDRAMERILQRYMTDPVNSTPALLEVVAEEAGQEDADRFRTVLAKDDRGD